MNKNTLYKTAKWNVTGEYVKIIKYWMLDNSFDIQTIKGEKYTVWVENLSEFCL